MAENYITVTSDQGHSKKVSDYGAGWEAALDMFEKDDVVHVIIDDGITQYHIEIEE